MIRDYLGHASVATTSRNITTNLRMKREALEAFWKRAGLAPHAPHTWRPSPKLSRIPRYTVMPYLEFLVSVLQMECLQARCYAGHSG